MKADKIAALLLELDQQIIAPRPSPFGEAAETVLKIAAIVDQGGSTENVGLLGDWRSIDVSAVNKPATGELKQPILDEIGIIYKLG